MFRQRGEVNRPIRRRLACVTLFYMAGVAMAKVRPELYALCLNLCVFLTVVGIICALRRRSALFCIALAMFCLGGGLAGRVLSIEDAPTAPGTRITGRVSAIVSQRRVILSDVTLEDGRSLARPVAVTLMMSEEEPQAQALVGQTVEGTGRLYEQDEPRNPGDVDRRIQALCDGYELSGYILPGWTASGEAAFAPMEAFRVAREAVLDQIERTFGEEAALYQAVLLGEQGDLAEDVLRSMRLTGTAHILTVSGLHLSLLSVGLEMLLRRILRGRKSRMALKTALLTMFACLTGGAAGTVRALIMAVLRDLAAVRGRRYDSLTALSAAALAMALYNPVWPLSGSFQFSFFVVLGILLLTERLQAGAKRLCPERLQEVLRAPMGALCISGSAQLAALPMQLLFYGYVPLLALPMNMVVGALAPALMVIGAICTLASVFSTTLGMALAAVLSLPGRAFEQASVALAQVNGAILRLPSPSVLLIVFAAVLMALCSSQILWHRRTRRLRPALALLLLLMYLPRFCPAARYVQLDVGQGDAAVIRSGRHAVLVDVGPESSYAALRYLRHEGLSVDAILLSHLDEDHAGALGTLLASEIEIPMIVMAERAEEDVASIAVIDALAKAREQGIALLELTAGDHVQLLKTRFDVLSPDDALVGSNERSLLLYASVEGVRLLLTGDLPIDSEPGTLPDCDVLKVAHHGSRYATSRDMLLQTMPQVALISVGAGNSYGHPTERVLEDLASVGARTYRTDESGCVTLWLQNGSWRAQTYLSVP